MADQRWWPISESKQVFRHLAVTIEIALALKITTVVFTYLIPEWKEVADNVDGLVFVGLLIILGIKLLRGFWYGNGLQTLAIA
jgi:hypothetical protein